MPEPTKAYEVTYAVRVEMAGIVYAHSAADAVAIVLSGDHGLESTGDTRKIGRPRARRAPDEDLPTATATPPGGSDA